MPPGNVWQIYHRRVTGGGGGSRVVGPSRMDCAMGYAIHQDFSYEPLDRQSVAPETWKKHFYWFRGPRGLTVSHKKEWPEIVNRIYLGTLLYHFYLEREMIKWESVPGGIRITYAALPGRPPEAPVISQCVRNKLKVTWGDVVVALDDDRFLPRGEVIYAYSQNGSQRDWVLPKRFRGKKLELFTLSKAGRGPAPQFKRKKDKIHLKLAPRVPVKIIAK